MAGPSVSRSRLLLFVLLSAVALQLLVAGRYTLWSAVGRRGGAGGLDEATVAAALEAEAAALAALTAAAAASVQAAADAAAAAAAVASPSPTPPPLTCGPARFCAAAAWVPGTALPAFLPQLRTPAFAREWPPESGPQLVPTTPGLTALVAADNDGATRAAWGGGWRTPIVIVPSVYTEYAHTMPGWVVASLWSSFRSLYLYQRTDASAPRFAPNFGTESGVYFRFIVDHYDDLPDITVFVHMYPEAHNLRWLEWVHALRPNASFFSLSDYFIDVRAFDEVMTDSPYSFWAEQCLRNLFEDAGEPLPPGERLIVSQWCCAEVFASREMIRRRPKAVYEKILRRIGTPPGLCHLGAPARTDMYHRIEDPRWLAGEER